MKSKLLKILVLCILVSTVFFAVSCKNNGKESQSQSQLQSESVDTHVCDFSTLKTDAIYH